MWSRGIQRIHLQSNNFHRESDRRGGMNSFKRAVYTVNFGRYDSVVPPVPQKDSGVDFFLVTDQERFCPGWSQILVDTSHYSSLRLANRVFKMLGYRCFSNYHSTLYIDSNIAVIGSLDEVFTTFENSKKPVGLFPHFSRTTVEEEAETCLALGKIADRKSAKEEIEELKRRGYEGHPNLLDGGLIFRVPKSESALVSMESWIEWFERWQSRDQLSLPYALLKSQEGFYVFGRSPRLESAHFGFHRHLGGPLYKRLVGFAQRTRFWFSYFFSLFSGRTLSPNRRQGIVKSGPNFEEIERKIVELAKIRANV